MNLQAVPCPLCKEKDSFIAVGVPGPDLHIRKYGALYAGMKRSLWKVCGRCGFVHQNPRPTIEALNRFYEQSKYHAELASQDAPTRLEFGRWYFGEKIEYAMGPWKGKPGRVFDIGCGQGEVLKLCETKGWKAYGVEPDPVLADYAVNEFGLRGVRQGILDRHLEIEEQVDLVFTNHAFEHFADLDEIMVAIRKILKPDGYLFIAIPTYYENRSSLSKRWMNSAHYSLFTHRSLNNLLCRHGIEEVSHTYRGWRKEVDDLWFVGKFTGRPGNPNVHFEDPDRVSRYLRLVNPLRSLAFWPVYSNWSARVLFWHEMRRAARLLVESPRTFLQKAIRRVQRMSRSLIQ